MTETPKAKVRVSRCGNYREDVDAPCTGSLWAAPGVLEARCDTCGGYNGMAVLPDYWPTPSPPEDKEN